MKKLLSALLACVCVLLAVAVVLPGVNVSAKEANKSALVGASLFIEEKASLVFCFDPDVIAAKKATGKTFSFTVTYPYNDGTKTDTFTESDLEKMKDPTNGTIYQTITIGPFTAIELDETISYSGTMTEKNRFSLTSLAQMGVKAYSAKDSTKYATMIDMLKSFANYSVAVKNYKTGKIGNLPYDIDVKDPGYASNRGIEQTTNENGDKVTIKTPLNPERAFSGRSFVLKDSVFIKYTGPIKTSGESKNWTITINSEDVTSSCELKESGSTFSIVLPIHADQGLRNLRTIIRDQNGKVIFDCVDRADQIAFDLGKQNPVQYSAISHAICHFLTATSNYSANPVVEEKVLEEDAFYAGFGRADITPYNDPTELNTPGTDSTEFLEGIYTSCVALRDTKGTVSLIFSIDVRNIQTYNVTGVGVPYNLSIASAKDAAEDAGFTIDADQIFFVATHNHNAPSVTSTDQTVVNWYKNFYLPGIVEATKEALLDMTKVTGTYTGSYDTDEGTNYNRRYSYSGSSVSGYEDEMDKEVRVIQFVREGEKDILLVNWQAHAANILDPSKGTADFVGTLRATLENDLDVHFLYVNGASGDLNMTKHSSLGDSNKTFYNSSTGKVDYIGVGKSVAKTVKTALSNKKAVSLGDIKTSKISTNTTKNGYDSNGITTDDGRLYLQHRKHVDGSYCMTLNTYKNGAVINCQQCYDIYQMHVNAYNNAGSTKDEKDKNAYTTKGEYTSVTGIVYQYYKYPGTLWDSTITSTGKVTSGGTTYNRFKGYKTWKEFICARDQYSHNSTQVVEFDLWTMTIGDEIGFAFAPYEMFNQNGVDLRAAVNDATGGNKTIFTAGYTNGYMGYIASEVAFNKVENRSKGDDGTFEVDSTKYKKGCAEYFQTLLSDSLIESFNN